MIGVNKYVEAFVVNTLAGIGTGRNQIDLFDPDDKLSAVDIMSLMNVNPATYAPYLWNDATKTRTALGRNDMLGRNATIVMISENIVGLSDPRLNTLIDDAMQSRAGVVGNIKLVLPSRGKVFR